MTRMSMLPCRVLCLLAIVFCCVGVSDAKDTSQAQQVSANNTAPLVGDTISTSGITSAAATRVSSVVNRKSSEIVKEALQFANKLVESITAAHTKAKTAPESYDNVVQTITEEKRRAEDAVAKAEEVLNDVKSKGRVIATDYFNNMEKMRNNRRDGTAAQGEEQAGNVLREKTSDLIRRLKTMMEKTETTPSLLDTAKTAVEERLSLTPEVLGQAEKVLSAAQSVETTTRSAVEWAADVLKKCTTGCRKETTESARNASEAAKKIHTAATEALQKATEMQEKVKEANEKATKAVELAKAAVTAATQAIQDNKAAVASGKERVDTSGSGKQDKNKNNYEEVVKKRKEIIQQVERRKQGNILAEAAVASVQESKAGRKKIFSAEDKEKWIKKKEESLNARATATVGLTKVLLSTTNTVVDAVHEAQEMERQASDALNAAKDLTTLAVSSLRTVEETAAAAEEARKKAEKEWTQDQSKKITKNGAALAAASKDGSSSPALLRVPLLCCCCSLCWAA